MSVQDIIDRIWTFQGESIEEWIAFRDEIWPEIDKLSETDLEILIESNMTEMLSMVCEAGKLNRNGEGSI